MSAEQAVKEEPREAHPEDEETVYYPDFYDPAMLCASPLVRPVTPLPRPTPSPCDGLISVSETNTPRPQFEAS